MMKIDLHVHSNCSDGSDTVKDIFNNYYRRLAGLPPYPTRAELNAYQEEHGYSVDLTPVYRSKYIIMTPYADMVDKEILDLYPTEIKNSAIEG